MVAAKVEVKAAGQGVEREAVDLEVTMGEAVRVEEAQAVAGKEEQVGAAEMEAVTVVELKEVVEAAVG